MCRQFDTMDDCCNYINDAFDKWPVRHVSVFKDGLFLTCYWMSPRQCAAIHAAVQKIQHNERKLYGNYINR